MGSALAADKDRLAAAGTLAVTASGVTLMGVGSAFWGLCFGLLVLAVDRVLQALTQMCVAGRGRGMWQALINQMGRPHEHFVVAAVAAFVLSLPGAVGADAGDAAAQAVREITKIAGEVYRFRNNDHFSVFAVTSAGIIATDPINAPAATWLKDEMKKRWPDKRDQVRGLQP